MKKKLLFLGVCLLTVNICTAQSVLNAAGGDVKTSEASVSWSIGQTFYQVAEGVQIPYEILNVTGINDMEAISLNVAVYPNPTPDFLELRIDERDFDYKTGSYRIADMNGKVLISEKINDFHTRISMEKFPKGVYLLEVMTKNDTVKTFKIVKN